MASGGGHLLSINAFQLNGSGSFTGGIYILKPHGSLNWLVPLKVPYAYGGNGMQFEEGPIIVPATSEHMLRYVGKETFNYITLPDGSRAVDVSPCILPPTFSKLTDLPLLRAVRNQEQEAIKNVEEIYVLGWSVPKTDQDQESLIRSAIASRSKAISAVTVVNQGAPPEYFQRIADLFGVEKGHLKIFNAGFCDFVTSQNF
jgi:hypothetical protein